MRGDDDEKDAKAFRDAGFMDLIDTVDAMPPPVFHAEITRGIRRGAPLCGDGGFTRSSASSVTCPRCKTLLGRRVGR